MVYLLRLGLWNTKQKDSEMRDSSWSYTILEFLQKCLHTNIGSKQSEGFQFFQKRTVVGNKWMTSLLPRNKVENLLLRQAEVIWHWTFACIYWILTSSFNGIKQFQYLQISLFAAGWGPIVFCYWWWSIISTSPRHSSDQNEIHVIWFLFSLV